MKSVQSKRQIEKRDFYVPTYIMVSHKGEQKHNIQKEFKNRDEFDVTFIDMIRHPTETVGQWESLKSCIIKAESRKEDIIIVCKDEHVFPDNYCRDYLVSNIIEAGLQGIDLLLGGIEKYGDVVPIANNRYWVDNFHDCRFFVLFKPIFGKIIEFKFKDTDDFDSVLYSLSKGCCVIYPFVSKKKESKCFEKPSSGDLQNGYCKRGRCLVEERLGRVHSIWHRFASAKVY